MSEEIEKQKRLDWIKRTETLLASLPGDYRGRYAQMVELSHTFRASLAAAMEPLLNAQLKALPQETYEQKHALVTWVNHELRLLGLAIRCPKTGLPAILVADTQDAEHSTIRFRLQIRDTHGKQKKTGAATRMFDLELIEDAQREEGLSRWSDRTGRDKGPRPSRAEKRSSPA